MNIKSRSFYSEIVGRSNIIFKAAFNFEFYQQIVIYFIAFILIFGNGRPFFLSNGLYCLVLCVSLFALNLLFSDKKNLIPKEQYFIMLLLVGWMGAATLSLLVNLSSEVVWNTIWGIYVPILMYFTFVKIRLNESHISNIVIFFALGAILRFGYGAYIFYQEWGILPFNELLTARFTIDRMETYRYATFENTANTASILAIIFPLFITALVTLKLNLGKKVILILSICIIVLNVFITSSRAAIDLIILMPLVVLFIFKSRWRYIAILIFSILVITFYINASDRLIERSFFIDSPTYSTSDHAISERWNSIYYGMAIMKNHPLGIGYGMSYTANPFSIAHQFLIYQGNELGWLAAFFMSLLFLSVCFKIFQLWARSKESLSSLMFFSPALLTWVIYAFIVNIASSSGATITWIGLFLFFLSLSNNDSLSNKTVN